MDDVARLSPDERAELFQETAARRGIARVIIEKDFWVCWTLKRLFGIHGDLPKLLFKGGTSLSKVFNVIGRFSEDIDLSLDRHGLGFTDERDPENAPSQAAAERLLKELREECRDYIATRMLPALEGDFVSVLRPRDAGTGSWQLEIDPQDPQTVYFTYPQSFAPAELTAPPYINPVVRLEFGARSDHWPAGRYPVTSYAAQEFPDYFKTPSCDVTTLKAERTFWEKATLLHAEYHRPKPKGGLSRHYYDLAMLACSVFRADALAHMDLLEKVAHHKDRFFHAGWANYKEARPGTLRLVPHKQLASVVGSDYEKMKEMFFEDSPTFDELIVNLRVLEDEINSSATPQDPSA